MKRKITLFFLVAVLVLAVVSVGVMAANSMSFRVGRCIKATNGSCMLLMDNSPVVLSNHTLSAHPFSNYRTGDLLLVLHDGVQETYPGGTAAYLAVRLDKGSPKDVPQPVLDTLAQLGWDIQK